MLVARRYLVTGRVHGVGFRVFAADAALREGLGGWVRNLADGRVEIVAEGDREAIGRFERTISRGPSRARVDRVDVTDDTPGGKGTGFVITHD